MQQISVGYKVVTCKEQRFALVIHLESKHYHGSAGAATTCILLLFCASEDSTADQN